MYEQDKLIEGTRRRYNRRWQPTVNKDFDELFSSFDQATLISNSRRLFQNDPIVTSVIEQKGFYSVGSAFQPKYTGDNKAWGIQARDFLDKWSYVASTDGQDLNTLLYLIGVNVDLDGDVFLMLTTTKTGYPQIQPIPAHNIGQRNEEKTVTSGRYKGCKITKGIITQKNKRPVAYRLLGATEKDDIDIPAQSIIHVKEQIYIGGQARGLPLVSCCVNQLRDLKHSQDLEITKQLLLASMAFIETNIDGEPNAFSDDNLGSDDRPSFESFNDEGGIIKFFKSNDGSKLEVIKNENPTSQWQNFQDTLTTACLAGLGWPKSMVGMDSGTGTNTRLEIQMAQKTVKDRQCLLMPVMQRMVSYAISTAIQLGLLPSDVDFYKWSYSTPPNISIDLGRDMKSILDAYNAGLINLTDWLNSEGKELEAHLQTRCSEEAQAILIRQAAEKQYGVTIDPLYCKLISSTQFQATTPTTIP
jgi:capsid protein